jgi:transposase
VVSRKEAAVESIAVVAMDIHKKFSKAVWMDEDENILGEARVSHEYREEMREFLRLFDSETDVVMEATFNWPWIADLVEEVGLTPHLAHAPRAREMAKGYSKSDRKDAIFLGKLWLAGEIFPESYLAPPEVRRMRSLFRTRTLLVRMRTALKNNIHGVFHKLGIIVNGASDIFSLKGRMILKQLDVDESSRREIAGKLAVIDDLELHIGKLERAIKLELQEDERAALIMTIPGVGELTAYAVLAEMGTVDRFPNGRALAAYAGLLPLDNESAEKDFGKHTSKRCNRFLKWAVIEGVTGAVRKSRRMKSLHTRVKARNKNKAGKARVAVGREMIELIHLVLDRKVTYTETPPPRPGSKKAKERKAARQRKRRAGHRPGRTARPVSPRQASESESGQPGEAMRPPGGRSPVPASQSHAMPAPATASPSGPGR